jgi:acetyl esterase/lipase
LSTPRKGWIELLLGRPQEAGPPIVSVEMIPERRKFFDLGELNSVDLPDLAAFHERVVLRERDDFTLTAEIYVPHGDGPFPVLLYMHGGAFCVWQASFFRKQCMRIAERGYAVVNLEHGLAPEHPFPWAVEDVVYAARWIVQNIADYGGDAGRLGVGGDSSGGNLAAAAITFLHGYRDFELDEGDLAGVDVEFRAALLLYAVFDFRRRMSERNSSPGTTEIMSNLAYLGPHYLSKHENPLVSPALAPNLDRFPPAYLCCGAWDAVLPQSLLMAGALAKVGVPVTASIVPEADHEFLQLREDLLPGVDAEWDRIFGWLDRELAGKRSEVLAPA